MLATAGRMPEPLFTSARYFLPGIVNCIGDCCFSVRLDGDGELDRLGINFAGRRRLLGQLPVVAAIEVLDYADVCRFFFMVADANLEGLVHPVLAVFDVVIGALAL